MWDCKAKFRKFDKVRYRNEVCEVSHVTHYIVDHYKNDPLVCYEHSYDLVGNGKKEYKDIREEMLGPCIVSIWDREAV